ncbi:efflux RND transporter periplasmic adaptor subunit [Solemya velesiana gill symbiont]|uniref:Efflux transporter periplasmic adaptor subunit n=1 Tax=Solemya velesiana gill symbiont TaxID=1918948 RepID=A0A1T2KXP9_9GAMM|nr:efflux RND transporter periplasmic adaptor subunit [Solemya velesiana gill symbiont]OOZ37625.1 efflux transporter periplasmic adaptor subunit [Solemya velesiana gill symbiont]
MISRITFLLTLGLSMAAQAGTALETATAENRETPREYRLDGVVEAVNQSTVSAQTQGQIEEILFDIDDYVKRGTLIVRLKDTEQRARLAQAEADLNAASAQLKEARNEHARIEGIFEKKLVSRSAMDKANSALKSARARHDAAKAGQEQAREQFEYTRVRAPYSGIVTHRHIEIGEMANPGQKLMSGISLDQLRVNVDVPQSLTPAIRKIGKASVQQPGNGYIPASKITIFPYAHHGSNTFKVRLDLPEGSQDMFPGMFVKTAFITGTRKQLLVPASAVVYRSEVTGVYVVSNDGRISLRHVRAGHPTDDDRIAILSGLSEGEKVALDPIAAGARLKSQVKGASHE